MASRQTMISYLVKKGRRAEAEERVLGYRQVHSTTVSVGGGETFLNGFVLHVSKAKKVTFSKGVGDKKIRREMPYFRLVFCRESGDGGAVFGVLFGASDKETFMLSSLVVGRGIKILKPQPEGEWNGIRLVSTPEPMFEGPNNWRTFMPMPMPETGFIAFCVSGVRLSVIRTSIEAVCAGPMCDGLYRKSGLCPCVKTSKLPRCSLSFMVAFEDGDDLNSESSAELGLRLQEFTSLSLTDTIVSAKVLEAANVTNGDELFNILDHAENAMKRSRFTVMGWWKAAKSSDDAGLVTPKAHIAAIYSEDEEITRYGERRDVSDDDAASNDIPAADNVDGSRPASDSESAH